MTPVKLPKRLEYGKKPSGNRRPSASASSVPGASRASPSRQAETANPGIPHATEALTVFLPWPPSTNNLFRTTGGRRFRTQRYLDWADEAGKAVMACCGLGRRVSGPVSVDILLSPPDRRKRDLDNLAKGPLDLIVALGLIEDDSKIVDLRLRWTVPTTMALPCAVRIARAAP